MTTDTPITDNCNTTSRITNDTGNALISLDEALAQMLAAVTPVTESEQLPLAHCFGRISAKTVTSPLNVPGFDNSAMDGYAVRLTDLRTSPLPVAGTSLAGQPYSDHWPAASCIRIMTGAPVPAGCDAIIMQEDCLVSNGTVQILTSPAAGQHIRHCGEDIHQGDTVIQAGQRLNAASLPLLASLGISELRVFRKLRIALFSTGDELQPAGQPLAAGQIYETNRLAIRLLLEQLGCEIVDFGIIKDDPQALPDTFLQADQQADVVISSAGVSVGDKDHTKTVLQQIGNIIFWRLAIKPGKPFAFGRLSHSWFCGLPGNPVSAVITFQQLVRPLLAKLAGQQGDSRPLRLRARAASAIHKLPGRLEFQRGILRLAADGQNEVSSSGLQGSHVFRSLQLGNCFIVLERERGDVAAGEWVDVEPFCAYPGQ